MLKSNKIEILKFQNSFEWCVVMEILCYAIANLTRTVSFVITFHNSGHWLFLSLCNHMLSFISSLMFEFLIYSFLFSRKKIPLVSKVVTASLMFYFLYFTSLKTCMLSTNIPLASVWRPQQRCEILVNARIAHNYGLQL